MVIDIKCILRQVFYIMYTNAWDNIYTYAQSNTRTYGLSLCKCIYIYSPVYILLTCGPSQINNALNWVNAF